MSGGGLLDVITELIAPDPRVEVRVVRLPHAEDVPLPMYATEGAAGMDLFAALPQDKAVYLKPGERVLVPCGFQMAIPAGFEGQVRPRSGLALKRGLSVLNSPGTIDSDFRGEVCVIVVNHGEETARLIRGLRVAQLVIAPVTRARCLEVQTLMGTTRGAGGFGSTGGEEER